MAILRHFRRLQFIDYLIRRRATGDLKSFAVKNRLSISGLSIVLQEMREGGFPIKFSRSLNTYYYEEDGELVKCLFIKKGTPLSHEEIKNIAGGEEKINNLCFSNSKIFEICDKA
jgi:hypothetical protein